MATKEGLLAEAQSTSDPKRAEALYKEILCKPALVIWAARGAKRAL